MILKLLRKSGGEYSLGRTAVSLHFPANSESITGHNDALSVLALNSSVWSWKRICCSVTASVSQTVILVPLFYCCNDSLRIRVDFFPKAIFWVNGGWWSIPKKPKRSTAYTALISNRVAFRSSSSISKSTASRARSESASPAMSPVTTSSPVGRFNALPRTALQQASTRRFRRHRSGTYSSAFHSLPSDPLGQQNHFNTANFCMTSVGVPQRSDADLTQACKDTS